MEILTHRGWKDQGILTTLKTFRSQLKFKFHVLLIEILLLKEGCGVQEHGGIRLIKLIKEIWGRILCHIHTLGYVLQSTGTLVWRTVGT